MNAVDAQLIDQLKWTVETVCSCFHVPPYMIGLGPAPPYANNEPLTQHYHSQCLQALIVALENSLDEGLGLGPSFGNRYGVELDIDDLIWMDTANADRGGAAGRRSGALSPDEAREKYFGLGAVPGGDTPYLQQQMFSLRALAERDADAPFSKPAPAPAAADTSTLTPMKSSEMPGHSCSRSGARCNDGGRTCRRHPRDYSGHT